MNIKDRKKLKVTGNQDSQLFQDCLNIQPFRLRTYAISKTDFHHERLAGLNKLDIYTTYMYI